MNQEVRSTLEQLKHKLYNTNPTNGEAMERKQSITPAIPNIPTADLFKPMSVSKATTHCLSLKITKPAAIQKLTGKPIDQIYTALWGIRNKAKKAKGVVIVKSKPTTAKQKDQKYITFLENRMGEWQAECRKQAHRISELENALAKSHETRNVTSEVTEVMEEVMKLRGTVAYLESKLFGGK
jgi:hypothetical protein